MCLTFLNGKSRVHWYLLIYLMYVKNEGVFLDVMPFLGDLCLFLGTCVKPGFLHIYA